MPLWTVDSEKFFRGEYWTNRYWVSAATLELAQTAAASIVDIERAVHSASVNFTRVRTSDGLPNTDVYSILSINQPGLDGIVEEFLPLFNVARIDFNTIGGGRPSRKYLRLPFGEGQVTLGQLSTAELVFLQNSYVAPLVALGTYVDVDGQVFSNGTVSPQIGMRQLRRGSKRKALPIIP